MVKTCYFLFFFIECGTFFSLSGMEKNTYITFIEQRTNNISSHAEQIYHQWQIEAVRYILNQSALFKLKLDTKILQNKKFKKEPSEKNKVRTAPTIARKIGNEFGLCVVDWIESNPKIKTLRLLSTEMSDMWSALHTKKHEWIEIVRISELGSTSHEYAMCGLLNIKSTKLQIIRVAKSIQYKLDSIPIFCQATIETQFGL
jgi:hypothetical protein